ncbi:MAG: type IV pilin-like G/H family protein [Oscillatoriaceae cyanobacterium Prado104]|jgi:type II secretory pathway pseudopilin PulG|nr:type IV pilin-like G/H family protein [Oscillatoriaceae cyanobacterium Prado104]
MSQQKSKLASIFLIVDRGCGCLFLMFIAVMGAIAMPTFLNMAYKAKRSEAKQYLSSMNKGQQAYYAEKVALANSIDALGLGIKTETKWYKYSIRATKTAVFHYALAKEGMLKNHVSAVFLVPAKELYRDADRDAITTLAILCETNEERPLITFKPADKPAEPIYQNGKVICGKGTTEVTK